MAKAIPSNSTKTFKINTYLPPFPYYLIKSIAAKNGEAVASVAKRLLIPRIEETASASFRASNFLKYAIANNSIPAPLLKEIEQYQLEIQMLGDDDDEDESEVD